MVIDKRARLFEAMKAAGCNAMIITNMDSIRYVTGFTGSSGTLIVYGKGSIFFTDSRYIEQANDELHGIEVRQSSKRFEEVFSLLKADEFSIIGFEDSDINFSTYQLLKNNLRGKKLIPLKEHISGLRLSKTAPEVKLIRKAIKIAEASFTRILPIIRPGASERDISIELEYNIRKEGADSVSFESIVAAGCRSALPHGRPGNNIIKKGDPVVIDFGARFGGYCSDQTITVFAGKAGQEEKKIYNIVKEAHDRAIAMVRPGEDIVSIDRAARGFIEESGYGRFFGHGTGHGVGLEVHEAPAVSPYGKGKLLEGMVITVEPGIYIPGSFGVRIEDMILVTADGGRKLTRLNERLWEVE